MTASSPKALDTLYLLVHPGHSIETHAYLTYEGRELLDTCIDVATTLDRAREALVIISHKTRSDIQSITDSGETNVEWPILDAIRQMEETLRDRFGLILEARWVGEEEDCREHLAGICQVLERMRVCIADHTRLVCIGETAGSCVPNAAMHFRTLLGMKPPAIVPLELTNARVEGHWQNFREGGDELEYVREKFPTIEFIPIPSDFDPLSPPTQNVENV